MHTCINIYACAHHATAQHNGSPVVVHRPQAHANNLEDEKWLPTLFFVQVEEAWQRHFEAVNAPSLPCCINTYVCVYTHSLRHKYDLDEIYMRRMQKRAALMTVCSIASACIPFCLFIYIHLCENICMQAAQAAWSACFLSLLYSP
jgi:hypothetical protein